MSSTPQSFADLIGQEVPGAPASPSPSDLLDRHLSGLALSGGGIRSATFSLGVVQYLAQLGLLSHFHYLSTVSGGGYLGSWLSAWIARSSLEEVQRQLIPPPIAAKEAEQIRWLRRYGKFLAPKNALFSADTWTIVALWTRNTILNLTVLIVFLLAVLSLPWAAVKFHTGATVPGLVYLHAALVTGATLCAAWFSRRPRAARWWGFVAAASLWLASILYVYSDTPSNVLLLSFWGFALAGFASGSMVDFDGDQAASLAPRLLISVVVGAVAMSCAPYLLKTAATGLGSQAPAFIPPLVCFAYCLILTLLMGALGRHVPDERREWWSRAGAWVFILSGAWMLLSTVIIHGPSVIHFLGERVGRAILSGGLWGAATGIGVWLGRNSSTNGASGAKSPWVERILPLLPATFVAGLLLLLATLLQQLFPNPEPGQVALVPPALVLLFALLGWLIDVNDFSMHRFYRNRLVRAFQGASTQGRDRLADKFTNLHPDDDLKITDLQPKQTAHPIHLVNTAVNVNLELTGVDDRRAASFVFTPFGCGYRIQGEDHCRFYPDPCDLRLGTPITASGAAASPNMGYHTSAAVAFLLTIFNVRLGYWIFNTNWKGSWEPRGPRIGIVYFVAELFALAGKNRKYVYLSDGGHFENLAVYELLRRRCRYVVCVDAEQDYNMKFEGLAGLIRRARSDFGIEINIDIGDIEQRSADGWSRSHCAVGDILYPEGAQGHLLYLKLSVTGDEPVDLIHYRKANAAFPHQSTGDQFFDESQFESYRRLGYHVAEQTFISVPDSAIDAAQQGSLAPLFEKLANSWYGNPRTIGEFTRHTDALNDFLGELSSNPRLAALQVQLNPRLQRASSKPAQSEDYLACFLFCQRLIQLMENVYTDLDLESTYKHPYCRGWMEQFRDWAQSELMQETYQNTKHTFGDAFINFYEHRIRPNP